MKKFFLALCFIMLLPSFVIAEDDCSQKIIIKRAFCENQYYYKNKKLKQKQLNTLLEEVPEALPEVQKAKKYSPYMKVFASSGGFLIGYSISSDDESKEDLTKAGCISTIIAIRFQVLMDRHYQKAVEIYNSKFD